MEIIQRSDRSASVAKRRREDEDEDIQNSAKVGKYNIRFLLITDSL